MMREEENEKREEGTDERNLGKVSERGVGGKGKRGSENAS